MKLRAQGKATGLASPVVGRITTRNVEPNERTDSILLWRDFPSYEDLGGYLAVLTPENASIEIDAPLVHSVPGLDHLADGDVVAIDPRGFVRTLYRRGSPHNFIMVTEECNSYCLMCSQPPRPGTGWNIDEHLRLVELIDPDVETLGITGGEPTLMGDDFLRLIQHCKNRLPNTRLHVLTNGRLFYYRKFAEALAGVGHPFLTLGIPLYSDVDSEHDYVVQAKGAFEETIIGLHNLERHGIASEIRVVVHKQTYRRLPQLAAFITRNLPFAAHVALMGLEMVGFVHFNRDQLWIDPADYSAELVEATFALAAAGMNVSIYNQPLCILDRRVWPYARKSISDWKNIYVEECENCAVQNMCGGFFQSAAKAHSSHIRKVMR